MATAVGEEGSDRVEAVGASQQRLAWLPLRHLGLEAPHSASLT